MRYQYRCEHCKLTIATGQPMELCQYCLRPLVLELTEESFKQNEQKSQKEKLREEIIEPKSEEEAYHDFIEDQILKEESRKHDKRRI